MKRTHLALLPDLTEAASDFSTSGLVRPADDPLGLSVFTPGILFRSAPLNDLFDSFVSALLNDGYDWRSGLLSNDVCDAPKSR